jgi:aminotransferase
MIAAMLGLLDPGDEIVVFEPFYENYGPDAILAGAIPRYVTLHEPDWSIDEAELRAAFGPRTRAIIINSPHNPTGKVYTLAELEFIAGLCIEFNALAFTDDIYEHIVFEGEHIPLATLPGMGERTVSIHSMSKSYSVTGWRIGWTIAPPDLSVGIRRVHDFLTVGAAAPLQAAAVVALGFPDSYYADLVAGYRARRDILVPALRGAGFRVHDPAGAYYVMTDITDLAADGEDDVAFALRLIDDPGVAAVPGSSFFSRPELGRTKVRFAFPKRAETLAAATERLATLSARV